MATALPADLSSSRSGHRRDGNNLALWQAHKYGACSMVGCIKTTVEIADPLLAAAKRAAAARRTTLRALVEAGLRRVLDEQPGGSRFELRDVSFGGEGLAAEFAEGGWSRVRDTIYERHGA
jgi:hypothetical protein